MPQNSELVTDDITESILNSTLALFTPANKVPLSWDLLAPLYDNHL
jgi:hypothetical protein